MKERLKERTRSEWYGVKGTKTEKARAGRERAEQSIDNNSVDRSSERRTGGGSTKEKHQRFLQRSPDQMESREINQGAMRNRVEEGDGVVGLVVGI